MLKRLLLLCLGLWLIAASGLAAHAGPCSMQDEKAEAVMAEAGHEHCDMMGMQETPAPNLPDHPDPDGTCCCPAVLAALPAAVVPDAAQVVFGLPSDFPLEARAPSRTLLPEPRPPKA
jgi:hypothetical protein